MYIGIDLGSTNLKAALFDDTMRLLCEHSSPVRYFRENGFVEFDAEEYVREIINAIRIIRSKFPNGSISRISFTGQAESLVVLDQSGKPLMNAISWMDERSSAECAELEASFSPEECEKITGQLAILPTWPATKIMWLRKHRPEIFAKAKYYMLLKDYVVYCMTGVMAADASIATFSFYFDIFKKQYWKEMLDYIGVKEDQLPPICEPCTDAGALLPEICKTVHISDCIVNVGTLDHFAGMIGTGNTASGDVTLSTGTVMAMSALCAEKPVPGGGIALHYGFLQDRYVMLPVAESGGVSLEWFRRTCMNEVDYQTLNSELKKRQISQLLFLPYLVGTNAPEFDKTASGVFWGLRQEHDAFDMARSVMEGVSFLLRKNCESMTKFAGKPNRIFATGGGAKSDIWCQMQADITETKVLVPENTEAACLGAGMIGAVADGRFSCFEAAANACVKYSKIYIPRENSVYEQKYRRFSALYDACLLISKIK